MKRPKEKDYFEYHGKTVIGLIGSCEKYASDLNSFITELEWKNKELIETNFKVLNLIDREINGNHLQLKVALITIQELLKTNKK